MPPTAPSPEAAPAKTPDCGCRPMGQRQADCCTFRDILQTDAKAQRQRTADSIRLPGQSQCSGKARHHTLGQVVQCYSQHHASAVPGPAFQQLPGKLFHLQKAHCASTSPTADGIHAGSGKVCPRWIAGSSRLHTLAASIMPAAMPHRMRCVQGRDCRRSKNTPAAPSVVHAAGNSSTHAVKTILVHDAFPLCPVYVRRSKKVQKSPSHKKYSATGFSVRMRWHLLRCQSHSPAL